MVGRPGLSPRYLSPLYTALSLTTRLLPLFTHHLTPSDSWIHHWSLCHPSASLAYVAFAIWQDGRLGHIRGTLLGWVWPPHRRPISHRGIRCRRFSSFSPLPFDMAHLLLDSHSLIHHGFLGHAVAPVPTSLHTTSPR